MIMLVLGVGVVMGWASTVMAASSLWEPLTRGLNQTRTSVVAVAPQTSHLIYAGSAHAVSLSRDGGLTWRECLRVGSQAAVTFIAIDPFDERHVLVATSHGLYGSSDDGRHWKRLSRGSGTEAQCQVVVFHPVRRHEVWMGTVGGLWLSTDGGQRWQQHSSALAHHAVRHLAIDPGDPQRLYAVTDRGLFVSSGEAERWQRLFETTVTEDPLDAPEEPPEEAEREADTSHHLTAIAIDPQDPHILYLAGSEGLFISQDRGAGWQRAAASGLGATAIRHLTLQARSPTVVYAATPHGIARYRVSDQRWEVLYAGLPTQGAHFVAATETKVYAATEQGLYMLDLTSELLAQGDWPAPRELLANFVHEPPIEQTQEAAVRYAEVQPEKIQRWRRQAYLKAFFPTFSIDYDRDKDTFLDAIGSTTNTTFDRILRVDDPSQSLDVSLKWDFGDLIWNDDQTSIDVRSKLMVQLRDDILDEVTRTYFERRRLQVELLTAPPTEPRDHLDKELRLQELTAMLDGLTGGWFSRQIKVTGDR